MVRSLENGLERVIIKFHAADVLADIDWQLQLPKGLDGGCAAAGLQLD